MDLGANVLDKIKELLSLIMPYQHFFITFTHDESTHFLSALIRVPWHVDFVDIFIRHKIDHKNLFFMQPLSKSEYTRLNFVNEHAKAVCQEMKLQELKGG